MTKKIWILLICILIASIAILMLRNYLEYDLSSYKGTTLDLIFTPDSTLLVSYEEYTRNIQIWSTLNNRLVQTYKINENGRKLFFNNKTKKLFVIFPDYIAIDENGQPGHRHRYHGSYDLTGCMSKNGKYLVMNKDHPWPPESYVYLTDMITYWPGKDLIPNQFFKGYSYQFICQDKILFCKQNDIGIVLKEVKTWQNIKILDYPITDFFIVSENGKFIIGCGKKHNQELWSIETDQKIKDLPGYSSQFTEDSQFFAHANPDHTISIYSLATGEVIKRLSGHSDKIYIMRFSPNGQWLASSGADKRIKLWNVNLPCTKETILSNLNESEDIDKIKSDWNLNIPKKCSEKDLLRLLKNPNPYTRMKAIDRISWDNEDKNEIISQLIQNLDDDDFLVINASVSKLSGIAFTINDPSIVEKIIIALIGTFKYATIPPDLIGYDSWDYEYSMPDDSIRALLEIHKKKNVLPYLVQALNSPDRYVRMHSAYALKYFKNFDENTLEALMQTFHDPEPEVRCEVIDTLQEITCKQDWVDKEKVRPIFIQALQDKDKKIQKSVISFLKNAKEQPKIAIPSLIQIFHSSSDIFLKKNIISILFNINDGTKEIVEKLLMESDIDTKNEVLIDSSCEGNTELAKLSINVGTDVNCHEGYTLSKAIENKHKEIVQILIQAGANVNIKRDNPFLWESVYYNVKIEIVKELLDAGANVNAIDKYLKETPLICASKKGYKDIVELLLKYGADIHAKNRHGETALMIASKKGYEDIVKILTKELNKDK